jgi:TolB protein
MSPQAILLVLLAQQPYPAARSGGNYMHNYYIPPAPGSTPWAPAWAPDGKSLVVAMHGSLFAVDPESGDARELTYGKSYHSSPAVSPDGRWIVYTADDDARAVNLEILSTATGETRALTEGRDVYLDPVFSPDGTRLAYVSTRPNGHFNIYVRAVRDGRWAGEEIALTRDNRYPRDRLYFGPWDMHTQPAWTPDGKEIVFVSNRGVPLGSGDLMRMPAEADGIQRATRILSEQTLYRTRPDVSPDGRRVLYSSTAGAADQFNNLYVVPLAGGAPYKLTFGQYDTFHPRFSPEGEWIAAIANDGELPQLVLIETYGGKRRRVEIRARAWKRPMGRLHLRVADPKTGAPVAARVHGLASDGKFYAPADTYSRIGHRNLHAFHTQGDSVIDVPPGRMRVSAVRGFAYRPAAAEVDVAASGVTALVLRPEPLEGGVSKGWYAGSTHVHMNYGGNLHNTPENLLRMGRAEGLDAVMNLIANKDNRILDHQFFQAGGGEHAASYAVPDVKLHMGEEYRPPFYGHVYFLGLREHLISPFLTGYEGTAVESLYPSNTDMFRKAKAQGAVTGYVHAFSGERDPLAGELGVAKAFPVDAALGTIDCMEFSAASRAALAVWHHAWNNDLPVCVTGGEDSISNLHRIKLVGSVRTYAHVAGSFSIPAWINALRRGATYFTTGPLLDFRVDGKLPGEVVKLGAAGGPITLEGSVRSIAPLSKVVIHRNGAVFKDIPVGAAGAIREQVRVTGSGWYSLYAEGPPYEWLDADYPQAATTPVRVYVGEGKIRSRESAEYFGRWIDKLRGMAEAWPWWRSEKEKAHVFAQFDEARRIYQRLASEAQ